MSRKYKRDKVYPIVIDSNKTILEALDECPWYFYKASKSLRRDKKTCLSAIRRDPYTVMFVDEQLRNNDSDIRKSIINNEKYLIKYVDEYGELTDRHKNEIPTLGIQLLTFRNQLINDSSLDRKLRNDESYYGHPSIERN
ncbi:MAG: DUF4116 domain-containing protein [Erysipelotrichaceae bacterium]|nr:DUF4116 domain-containing protein [Erysipelotrichaceae bacterium]MBQ2214539.1 DUF4116 domain-containing protein [Erysipelotrichaceae bacterium]